MGIRVHVYNEFFPLTFYAKTDLLITERTPNGLRYLFNGLLQIPVLLVAGLLFVRAYTVKQISKEAVFLFIPIFLHLSYLIWAGGDHMPAARMMVPLLAPASLLLLVLFSPEKPRFTILAFSLSMELTTVLAMITPFRAMDPTAKVGGIVGRHIETTWPRNITVTLNTAGSTPFFASKDRIFIDMLGEMEHTY